MQFETEADALKWYSSEERVLTKEIIDAIPWKDIPRHELDKAFIPVMLYMRDVEAFTEIYFDYLRRGPTGKEKVVMDFMERWSTEEPTHAYLLNRFLNEAGFPTSDRWFSEAKSKIPLGYRIGDVIEPELSKLFGSSFGAVHMTWGAINELSTLHGYKRLWELAKHPVLEHILRLIAREESRHAMFYWSIARIKLQNSGFSQKLTKFMIDLFWTPVGQGAKPKDATVYVMKTLFSGDGQQVFDKYVNNRIQQLPGLATLDTINRTMAADLA